MFANLGNSFHTERTLCVTSYDPYREDTEFDDESHRYATMQSRPGHGADKIKKGQQDMKGKLVLIVTSSNPIIKCIDAICRVIIP